MLMLPTSSPTAATMEAMRADPIGENSKFGRYTNFANLLGLAAVAVPAGCGPFGLPAGVTLVGPGFAEDALAPFAARMHAAAACGLGRDRGAPDPPPPAPHVPAGWIPLAAAGAPLTGMPLDAQLTAPGGSRHGEAAPAPGCRLHALPGTVPPKPGRAHDPGFRGPGLTVEIRAPPPAVFGAFVAAIPAPLGVGKVLLADGRAVTGFLCEGQALEGAEEITRFGGWRAYLATR